MRKWNAKDEATRNWLRASDQGKLVFCTGHYTGDFTGTVKYGGTLLAVITDMDGVDREVCYMYPVQFYSLEPPPAPCVAKPGDTDDDIPF